MTCRLDSLDMFGKFRKFALGDTLIKEFNFDQLVYFFFSFLNPCQHLVLSVVQILAPLRGGVRCYVPVVLARIALMTCDVEHVFMCLVSVCISSKVRCLSGHWSMF